jgi:AcrR family transcriptional regulator
MRQIPKVTRLVKSSTQRRMSKDPVRTKSRQQAIYQSVAKLMMNHKTGPLSLDVIAQYLGGTKTTIYYYFKSKGEMLYKMSLYGFDLISEAVVPVLNDPSLSPKERLSEVVRQNMLVVCHNWQLWRSILNEVTIRETSPEGNRILSRRSRSYEKEISRLVEQAADAEGWEYIDSKTVTRVIMGNINSIGRWYRPDRSLSAEQIADYAVNCMLNGFFDKPN